MNLKLDLGYLNSVFIVPSVVVDNHIKLAGAVQLKVLLFVLRYAGKNLSVDDIAKALSLPCSDVKDALQYWIEIKLINNIDTTEMHSKKTNNDINKFDDVKIEDPDFSQVSDSDSHKKLYSNEFDLRKKIVSTRPDNKSIAERIEGAPEIKFLMQEAQIILARPISNADAATLLMLHDVDGLPVDVILMLLQYSVSIGKSNMRYIEKVAMSWGIEEINTIEKAEEKIKILEKNRIAWAKVQKILGIDGRAPTQKEIEVFNRWINDWNFSEALIKEAYDRCVNAKGKYILGYIDSIIKRWKNDGIVSLEQAQNEKNIKNSKIKIGVSPSYNIESYFETMDTFV